jgi:hypothetical protein
LGSLRRQLIDLLPTLRLLALPFCLLALLFRQLPLLFLLTSALHLRQFLLPPPLFCLPPGLLLPTGLGGSLFLLPPPSALFLAGTQKGVKGPLLKSSTPFRMIAADKGADILLIGQAVIAAGISCGKAIAARNERHTLSGLGTMIVEDPFGDLLHTESVWIQQITGQYSYALPV